MPFKELCSSINFAASPTYCRLREVKEVCKSLLDGLDVGANDFVIIAMDNLGFKKKQGYDQWVIIQLITVTEAQLRAVGFYRKNPADRISRHGISLEGLLLEAKQDNIDGYEKVFDTSKVDDNNISRYVHTNIKSVLSLPLPGYGDCLNMSESGDYTWPYCKIPNNLGVVLPSKSKKQQCDLMWHESGAEYGVGKRIAKTLPWRRRFPQGRQIDSYLVRLLLMKRMMAQKPQKKIAMN